jgi:pimeloyl-ACP methyl ester carboxylesterase
VPGPYVMVGHSLGGPLLMLYTHDHPEDVLGVVMVDASHPDQVAMIRRISGKGLPLPPVALMRSAAIFSWAGATRLMAAPDMNAGNAHVPRFFDGAIDESEVVEDLIAFPVDRRTLGDRPLVVITGGKEHEIESQQQLWGFTRTQVEALMAGWDSLQVDMSHWSTRGRRIVLPRAGHYVQYDRPDVVISAVREVMADVR